MSQTKHSPKERGLGELEEAHSPVSKRSHHLDQDHHYCCHDHEGDVKQGGRGGGGRDSSGKRRLWPSSCRHSQVIIVIILIVILIVIVIIVILIMMIISNRSDHDDQLLMNAGELGVESHLLAESRRGTGQTKFAVILTWLYSHKNLAIDIVRKIWLYDDEENCDADDADEKKKEVALLGICRSWVESVHTHLTSSLLHRAFSSKTNTNTNTN